MVLENSKISIGRFNEVNKAQMEEDREVEEKKYKYRRVIKAIESIVFLAVFVGTFCFLKTLNTTVFSIIIAVFLVFGGHIFYADAISDLLVNKFKYSHSQCDYNKVLHYQEVWEDIVNSVKNDTASIKFKQNSECLKVKYLDKVGIERKESFDLRSVSYKEMNEDKYIISFYDTREADWEAFTHRCFVSLELPVTVYKNILSKLDTNEDALVKDKNSENEEDN